MSDFRRLSDSFFASPQIELEDITAAAEAGVTLIICNRPDGEDPAALQSDAAQSAAAEQGINFVAIPVGHSGFSEPQIDQMIAALEQAEGNILAYCRSGTRSTLLWALAQAKQGESPDAIADAARAAGYDVAPIRPIMDMLASGAD